jgi:hypothetical protein
MAMALSLNEWMNITPLPNFVATTAGMYGMYGMYGN